jgi:pimeloyl-ACP methyl ester carboxylesterase
MERIDLRANGLDFGLLRHGNGPRRALLLHGFPDDPRSMEPLMERLADAGVATAAPWMRGYGPTDTPPDHRYHVADLAADAIGLMDALDWERPLVVGHDWGALASYAAANLAPHRIARLVTLSVPPAPIFARNLLRHPEQFRRSWYILFFQLPFAPEHWLSRRDFETLEELWSNSLRKTGRLDDHLQHVRETFRTPGTVASALSYYRHLVPRSVDDWKPYRRSLELSWRPVSRPTLMMTGDRDVAVGAEMFEAPESAFDAPHDLDVLYGAGHFVQLEAPDDIARSILDFCDVSDSET